MQLVVLARKRERRIVLSAKVAAAVQAVSSSAPEAQRAGENGYAQAPKQPAQRPAAAYHAQAPRQEVNR